MKLRTVCAALGAALLSIFATSRVQANTWKIIRDVNKTGSGYYSTVTECDDDGNPIEGGWVLRLENNKRVTSISQVSTISTVLNLALPIHSSSTSGYTIVGAQDGVFKTLGITEVWFPSGFGFKGNCLNGNSTVTKIVFAGPPATSINTTSRNLNASNLKEIVMKGGPITAFAGTTFESVPAGSFRMYVEDPDTDAWASFFAGCTPMADNTNEKLSLENYLKKFNDGTEPAYVKTVGKTTFWVVPKPKQSEKKMLAIVGVKTDDGTEVEFGTPTPAYSLATDRSTESLPLVCSIVNEFVLTNGVRYAPYAYQISVSVDNEWIDEDPVESLSYSYDPQDFNVRKLTWLWRPTAYQVVGSCPDGLGSVSISGATAEDGLYPVGSVLTVSAVDGEGSFVRWYGDVAESDVSNRTVRVIADNVKSLRPYFRKDWEYDNSSSPALVRDGYWALKVTGNDSLTAVHFSGNFDELDLSKAISGNRKFTAIGSEAFNGTKGLNMQTLVLSPTIMTISEKAFNGHGSLKHVLPTMFPNTISSIGSTAFKGCGLMGDLRISGVTSMGGNVFQNCSKIASVEVGGKLKNVPDYAFDASSSITSVVLRSGVEIVNQRAFRSCSSLAYVDFAATVTNVGDAVFAYDKNLKTLILRTKPTFGTDNWVNWGTLQARILISECHPSWVEYLADGASLTLWKDCGEDYQDAYKNAYPGERAPIGIIKNLTGSYWQWLCRCPVDSGMIILIR